MLIQTTDFTGEINYADDSLGDKAIKLCQFINIYEPEFMRHALGKTLAGIVGDWSGILTPRLEELRDGNGTSYRGLKFTAARYIYCHYMDDETSTVTMVGVKKEDAANSNNADSSKMLRQWNRMHEAMNELWWDYLYETKDTDGNRLFPEWEPHYCDIAHFRSRNSMDI